MSDIGIVLVLFAGVLTLVGIIRFLAWLTDLQERHGSLSRAGINTVKRYAQPRSYVMSRHTTDAPPPALSSKDGQSDGRTDSLLYERTELLMFYKLLRKYGIPREEARPVLKAMRIPLSNDVWASAAPPEQEHVTPIVGRPTNARFETDPDYPYQAPA
jgi:hypothetical protein